MKIIRFCGITVGLTVVFYYIAYVLWFLGFVFVAFCIWGDPGFPDSVTIRTIAALLFIIALFCSAAINSEID